MSPAFSTRRHADEFDRMVEAARSGTPASGPVPAELAELAAFAASLSEAPAVAPRPAFSADLRERLMAAAATELVRADDVTDRLTVRSAPAARRRHERRLTVGIVSLAIVGASAGTALASQGALPGQPLYPVKRAIESVRTGFTTSDSGKGSALLGDANTRLDEVAKLSGGSSDDSAQITSTLNAFAEQAKKASDLLLTTYQQSHDPAAIKKLQQFTSDSIDQLTTLEPQLPDSAKQALTEAAQTVLMIDTAAHNACPSCGGSSITSLPESLLAPVSQTLDSLTKPLHPHHHPSATKSEQPKVTLPSVPADVGPANLAPSTKPTLLPSAKTDPGTKTDKTDPIKKLLQPPSSPKAEPSSLGDVVQGVTDGVDGTVKGVLGTVDGVLGGLLGTTQTPAP